MHEHGIDIGGQRTKHLTEFIADEFGFVITLYDRVREVCPGFPDNPRRSTGACPIPPLGGSSDEETYPAFQRTAAELETRIRFLLHVIKSAHLKQEVS